MSNNIVGLEKETELVSLLRTKLREAQRGEIDGLIIISEYTNNAITDDMTGAFSDERNQRYVFRGILGDYARYFQDIDTEVHEYD